MAHTKAPLSLKITCSSLILAGLALMGQGSTAEVLMTGQGSDVFVAPSAGPSMFVQGPIHAAPIPAPNGIGAQIVVGMLLILLGFGIHAFFVLQHEKPIRVQKSTKKKKGKGRKKKTSEGFGIVWVQRFWP